MNQREFNRASRERFRGEDMRGESEDRERMRRELRDTYNPEPQWLRDDRERRIGRGFDDEYDDGRGRYVASGASSRDYGGEYSGRGSDAGSGREWGEGLSSRSHSGQSYPGGAYDNTYGGSGRDAEFYSGDARGWNERERYRYRGFSQGSRYGGEDEGLRGQYDDSVGARTRWDERDFSGGGGGRYPTFRVGTGTGLGGLGTSGHGRQDFGSSYGGSSGYGGPGGGNDSGYGFEDESARHWGAASHRGLSDYGSRAGWDLGTHQRDFGREQQGRGGWLRSFRGLGPQHYKRPDERIHDDVHERLTDSHHIDARNVMVDVNQGNVTLTGTVPERRMRYEAEDLVEDVMGVANINNQLKVQTESETQGATGTTTGTTGAASNETSSEPKRH